MTPGRRSPLQANRVDRRTKTIQPAQRYRHATDLWIITAYFNPNGYTSKRRNFEAFRNVVVDSGLNLLTVEGIFGTADYTCIPSRNVLHVRGGDLMWHKERLLNLAIDCLPPTCTKVAWLDCDVLFENPDWAVETSRLLDHYPLVQPFATSVRLPQGATRLRDEGGIYPGVAAVQHGGSDSLRRGGVSVHGDPGLAWAAQRSVVSASGLYDACIVGGADHLMAHAMWGDWTSPCVERAIGVEGAYWSHFVRWAEPFFAKVRGEVGYVSGAALHLWHGDYANRRYAERNRRLKQFLFDPERDVRRGSSGCREWSSDKTDLHRWVADYFAQRAEDDVSRDPSWGEPGSPARRRGTVLEKCQGGC